MSIFKRSRESDVPSYPRFLSSSLEIRIRRRKARAEKAARLFPRPAAGPLRPAVLCPTVKYNMKLRAGRGFTFDELKEAKINRHQAASIGIAVDYRRRNRSEKALKTNVNRLKQYKNKLVLFPLNEKKPKQGEATKEEQGKVVQHKGSLLPVRQPTPKLETIALKDLDTKTSATTTLKVARSDAKLIGVREKRAKKKAEDAALVAAKAGKTIE